MKPTRILFQSISKIKPCFECSYLNIRKNTCSKYTRQDFISAETCQIPAITCREDETKCGINARDYKQMTTGELRSRYYRKNGDIPVLILLNVVIWSALIMNLR
jgi:hypothetical protein